jgi:SP family general alpha glucoside:H+ symporter-like MFS transporter
VHHVPRTCTVPDRALVSSWSALLNVGQMVVQTHVALLADRYGRKVSFYYAWIWLVVVSTTH